MSKPEPAPQTCGDDDEEEDQYDQDPLSSGAEGSDSDSDCIDLDSDDNSDKAEEGCAGQQHQQHPQSFYKQPVCIVTVASAFQQLVKFVKQLPPQVNEDKAAAHLTTFESRKVSSCQHTALLQNHFCVYSDSSTGTSRGSLYG